MLLKSKITDKQISWTVVSNTSSRNCSRYTFKSKSKGSAVGERMILITLLRYAVLDCLIAENIDIDCELYSFEYEYLVEEVERMIKHSREYHGIEIQMPEINAKRINGRFERIDLDEKACFIGYSGGKDSSLCLELIEDKFDDIHKFLIDFDSSDFTHDFHENIEILDEEMYEGFSTKSFYNKKEVDYYQEEDLHCCFAAPYYGVERGYPMHLSVGLQFDVVNYYVYENEKLISEYGLTETYDSVIKFRKLMNSYGLDEFNIFVPLASANSFTIYNILNKKYGTEQLKLMNSCWEPVNGKPCGRCIKCQRVNFIYSQIGIELSDEEKTSMDILNNSNIKYDYLFGSISIMNLLELQKEGAIKNIGDYLFVDDKIKEIDFGFHKIISDKFDIKTIKNPLKLS